jgi:hypothetical protein
MPRGFDQPTSSSASRATNTGSREQTQQPSTTRTRQGRFEAPAQPPGAGEPPSSRRKSTNPPALTIPQQSGEPQPPSAGRKSPAYLQGKNPYGQVLDRIDHPYREPRADGPPSQAGASIEGRPRTSGSLEFKTRPRPQEPDPEQSAPSSDPRPPAPGRRPMSVRTAKNFFDTKASQHPSAPPLPPSATAGSKRGPVPKRQPPSPSRVRSARAPSPNKPRTPSPKPAPTTETEHADTGLLLSRLTGSGPIDSALSVIPFIQGTADQSGADAHKADQPSSNVGEANSPNPGVGEADQHPPELICRKATPPTDVAFPADEQSGVDFGGEVTGRRRSTNIFAHAPHDARPLGFERRAVDGSSALDAASNAPLIAVEESKSTDQRGTSEETVRRPSTRRSMPAAETPEAEVPNQLESQQQSRRPKSGRDIRRAFEEDKDFVPKRLPCRRSLSAPMTEGGSPSEGRGDCTANPSSTYFGRFRSMFGKPVDVRKRAEEIDSRGLSHDGSSSPSLSRRRTFSDPVRTADVGFEERYQSTEVPDDVDTRQGYGRRITQDFGYPGARIKRRTTRTKRPLQDPGHWVKRACGHFSYMGKGEHRDHAHERACRQCSTRAPPRETEPSRQHRTRRRAASDSTSSSSSSSKRSEDASGGNRRRRQHHSECLPTDKCGDTFAKDLGHIIDSILEEHANTLQGVINNIKHSQPNLAQLRRVSEDLVKRRQVGGVCTNLCHAPCRPPCLQQIVCQPVCQCQAICPPVCGAQVGD